MSGLARKVRPPFPCRPSKLRLLVLTAYWPGCSWSPFMAMHMLQPGQYAVSTSNRNFEGRQGKGGRTFLASPLTAAAAAVSGRITDPRTLGLAPV